ncbi:MAG: LLM class flavin-dependent oxidoreductase [Chloroflexi bacterium]|nr:LLM class flavin-dependent oxidoreductase [Chloroflexota bacterium]
MNFGLLLFGGLPEQSMEEVLRDSIKKAQAAREAGFDAVWVSGGHLGRGLQGTLLQARLTAHIPGMALGTLFLLPLEHPIVLAEELSTLDMMCGGKLTVAVAQGWREFQFDAFGIPAKQRLGRFLETLEAMKQLWAQDVVSYHGKYVQVDVDRPIARPASRPYPRILVAANADPGIQRAPSIADGWLISTRATYPTIEKQAALFKEAAQKAGKQPVIWAWREAYVAGSKRKAMETVRPSVEALYADRASLGHARDLPQADRIDVPFEQILKDRFIIGDPDQCEQEVRRYEALGVETIIMRMQWPGMGQKEALAAIRMMGREVLPRFR